MIVRQAYVETDWGQLFTAAQDFISRMDYTEYMAKDPDTLEATLKVVLGSPAVDIFVAEEDGVIMAAIGVMWSPFVWNPAMLAMEEVFWWAARTAPPSAAFRVIKHVVRLAESKEGSTVVAFKRLTSSPEAVHNVYTKLGLREIEANYIGIF